MKKFVNVRNWYYIPRFTSLLLIRCQITPYIGLVFISLTNSSNIYILVERPSMFFTKYRKFYIKNPYEYSKYFIIIYVFFNNLLVIFQTKTKDDDEFIRRKANIKTLIS